MEIRNSVITDIDEIAKLYRDTIIAVNAKDYTKDQIEAWASTYDNQAGWVRRMEEQNFYVAVKENKIIGFASIDKFGYFDLLYVHKDCQRQGIGTKLALKIEQIAKELELNEITVQASVVAKPFLEKLGYKVTGEKHKMVNDVPFTNTILAKRLVEVWQ
ncbi:MAG TPA: GNAT family N-acetyltransferase [Ferruginibacter sp.]|jgi:putative acetyltransferase|nr:GNAT family N-acetyltransferase [Ferruginibacter sp.]